MDTMVVGTSDIVPDVVTDASIEEKMTADMQEHNDVTDSAVAEHKTEEVVETVNPTGETNVPVAHLEVKASPLFRGDVIQRELYESPAPKSPVLDEEERPMDKRSGLVDRHRQLKQVLCYICCAEFGTTSLVIHQKTCLKKHAWGLENNILHEPGVDKKTAEKNRKKCVDPGDGPTSPVPTGKSSPEVFQTYNDEALGIFQAHSVQCLWCRERVKNEQAEAEAERRRREEEENKRRAQALTSELAAAEALERQRREELEALLRKKREEDEELEAAAQRARASALALEEEARRQALALEEARKRAEEEERLRLQALADALAAEQEAARLRALADEAAAAALKARQEEDERMRQLLLADQQERDALLLAEEIAAAEERRRMLLLAKGQHTYLKKGEGHKAAEEAGHVHNQMLLDEKAKHDIATYSISHAKKEGLLVKPTNTGSRPTSAVQMVEMDAALADAWHQDWSKDQEEAFALALRDNNNDNNKNNNHDNNDNPSTENTTLSNTMDSAVVTGNAIITD